MADYTFINPYTFVPFPKGGAVRYDLTDPANNGDPLFSGEIKCTLITKTQLAVPDTLKNPNASEDEIKEYDFFGIDIDGKRTAAIPGSGIRGVIRSVYETLTDSCVHLNDKDDDYFHTKVNKTTPGIIEYRDGSYILYEAERIRDKTDSKYSTGDIVTFFSKKGNGKASELVDYFSGEGNRSGVYLRVNTFETKGSKSHPSVFVKKRAVEKNFDKVYVDRLKINVKMYEGQYKDEYKKAIENMETKEGKQLPVWYFRDSATGHYYLAPSQYSRAVFVNQPKDIVEWAGVKSCTSKKSACAACALFGFIGNDGSRASRVRFTDAVCETKDCFDESYILPVLSGPRLSSFEFYLDGNGSKKYGPDFPDVTLAGRKFYWHNQNAKITADDEFAKSHPKMASKIELVKPECEFKFSVFFDKITDDQLKKLIFALNLGNNGKDSPQCHKIGHGKPLGLGSVKIVVDSVFKRSYEQGQYSVNDVTEDMLKDAKIALFRNSKELQAFIQRVLYFKFNKDSIIDYPRTQPGGDIFKWFADNRKGLRSQGYIEIKQTLPKITDNVQSLSGELYDSGNDQNGRNRNYSNRGYSGGRRN